MIVIALTALLAITEADRHLFSLSATLHDIDAQQVGDLIPGLPDLVKRKLHGKIGRIEVIVNQRGLALQATKFRIPNDPIQKIQATYLFRSRTMDLRVHGFGGVIEVSGHLPENVRWFDPLSELFLGNSSRSSAGTAPRPVNPGR